MIFKILGAEIETIMPALDKGGGGLCEVGRSIIGALYRG